MISSNRNSGIELVLQNANNFNDKNGKPIEVKVNEIGAPILPHLHFKVTGLHAAKDYYYGIRFQQSGCACSTLLQPLPKCSCAPNWQHFIRGPTRGSVLMDQIDMSMIRLRWLKIDNWTMQIKSGSETFDVKKGRTYHPVLVIYQVVNNKFTPLSWRHFQESKFSTVMDYSTFVLAAKMRRHAKAVSNNLVSGIELVLKNAKQFKSENGEPIEMLVNDTGAPVLPHLHFKVKGLDEEKMYFYGIRFQQSDCACGTRTQAPIACSCLPSWKEFVRGPFKGDLLMDRIDLYKIKLRWLQIDNWLEKPNRRRILDVKKGREYHPVLTIYQTINKRLTPIVWRHFAEAKFKTVMDYSTFAIVGKTKKYCKERDMFAYGTPSYADDREQNDNQPFKDFENPSCYYQ